MNEAIFCYDVSIRKRNLHEHYIEEETFRDEQDVFYVFYFL